MSGGADSSIIAYALALYKRDERPDISLIPISCNHQGKPFSNDFAKKIVEYIEKETGVTFEPHQTTVASGPSDDDHVRTQKEFRHQLRNDGIIQTWFNGVTRNPPEAVCIDITEQTGWVEDETRNHKGDKPTVQYAQTDYANVPRFMPFVNIDKHAVKEIYEHFGQLEGLFPLTRSCDNKTTDFTYHCNNCYWCKERLWGFGVLDPV